MPAAGTSTGTTTTAMALVPGSSSSADAMSVTHGADALTTNQTDKQTRGLSSRVGAKAPHGAALRLRHAC